MNNKRMILKSYIDIFKRDPKFFTSGEALTEEDPPSYSLFPLSEIIADLIDRLTHGEVLNCIKMLSSTKIDNYSERLISKLYEKYSSPKSIDEMFNANEAFFFEFSRAWPMFLRNNALFLKLTTLKNHN